MKVALYFYGLFRKYQKALPALLSNILYDELDYDVFILPTKNESSDNDKEKVFEILGKDKVKFFSYMEDMPEDVRNEEQRIINDYIDKKDNISKKYDIVCFHKPSIPRILYRKKVLNDMRKQQELSSGIKYDWIIMTRFDIFTKDTKLEILRKPPIPLQLRASSDLLSLSSPEVMDIETDFIYSFPDIEFFDHDNMSRSDIHFCAKWCFAPEHSYVMYLKKNGLKLCGSGLCVEILR